MIFKRGRSARYVRYYFFPISIKSYQKPGNNIANGVATFPAIASAARIHIQQTFFSIADDDTFYEFSSSN